MKEIKAIIRKNKLTDVIIELKKVNDLPGITISEVKGFGKSQAEGAEHKIVDDLIEYVPKIKLEIVVNEDLVNIVVDTIQKTAHTGLPGDGKIYVYEIESVIKIRTNEKGESAI
ncbi:MAG: P-II family nitrogen regulator [Ignavibacteria bacterium]